jgi:hypothetical protein
MIALSATEAMAHCFVGPRFLPATLATDDPCVADQISLPTVMWSKTGDVPAATEWDVSVDLSKRITEDFGISVGDTWSNIHQPGGFTQAGFGNLETTLQYQLLKDGPQHSRSICHWEATGGFAPTGGTPSSTKSNHPQSTDAPAADLPEQPDLGGFARGSEMRGQREVVLVCMTRRGFGAPQVAAKTSRCCKAQRKLSSALGSMLSLARF